MRVVAEGFVLRLWPFDDLRSLAFERRRGGWGAVGQHGPARVWSLRKSRCPGGADEGARDRWPWDFPLIRPSAIFSREGRRESPASPAAVDLPAFGAVVSRPPKAGWTVKALGLDIEYVGNAGLVGIDCQEGAIWLNANVCRKRRGGAARAGGGRTRARLGRALVGAILLLAFAGDATAQDVPPDAPAAARRIPEALRFAHGLFSQRKFDLAAEEYQRFLDTDPGPADGDDARFGLACARLFQGRYKESRAAFQDFLRLAPNHVRARTAWYRLGELCYMLSDLPAAREALERFTADPAPHANLETAWTYLGDVRLGLDDPKAAREAYETSLKRFPKGRLADRARYGLGRSLAALGETDAALDALEDLVEHGTADWLDKGLLQIGKIELAEGRFDQAAKAFARLAEAAPQSALATEAQLRRAEALMRLNRPDDAETLLRPLAADPAQPLSTEPP